MTLQTLSKIVPQFPKGYSPKALDAHIHSINQMLKKVILEDVDIRDPELLVSWANRFLPLVTWNTSLTPPDTLSIVLLCRSSKDFKIEPFFLDIIKKWLIPQKDISILSFQHFHFHFEDMPLDSFFICEVQVLVKDERDWSSMQSNLPILSQEIALGARSSSYATYILGSKPLSNDIKTTLAHQKLVNILHKYPNEFDASLFTEMARFLALSNQDFISQRSHRHLTRLICSHHLIRKKITRAIRLFPDERHFQMRFAATRLHFPFGTKPVLGLMLGICLFDNYELFEERHILLAAQKFVPHTEVVGGSFYSHQMTQDRIRMLYLELEKKDGSPFSPQEITLLKQQLASELKVRVEKLIPAVFMIRNEEEVMKNILILSQELKYFADLPQMMLFLENQSATDLVFTVILVRILKQLHDPLEKYFENNGHLIEFLSDRVQIVGYLRKKYPKEAHVFRLKIPKSLDLLRSDSSVNFYLARQRAIELISQAIGEVRDYNGGMILQQGEQISQLKQAFSTESAHHQDLLENFFYSISPIEMQATISQEHLHVLFSLFLEAADTKLPKRESYFLKVKQNNSHVFVMVHARDSSFKDVLQSHFHEMDLIPKALTSTVVTIQGACLVGYIYECNESHLQSTFIHAVQKGIQQWQKKLQRLQVLRLCMLNYPSSLDPRIGGEDSAIVVKMLFDGLMKTDANDMLVPAIAESVEISSDLKHYTFKLRKTSWSNGARVVAFDFEHAWKKILSPHFSTPFAYLFYPIKHAKLAKENTAPLSSVGIKAVDDSTLEIELEHPTPYFLELTAHPIYSPVNHLVDQRHPNWAEQEGKHYVCNGPFQLHKRSPSQGLELIKNHSYWDVSSIELDQVFFTQSNSFTAAEMFRNNEIDWIGWPLRSWNPMFSIGCPEKVESYAIQRVLWFVYNVERFPFNHPKLRQALAYVIDRKALLKDVGYEYLPATTPLPLAHTQHLDSGIMDGHISHAKALFEEALKELGLTRHTFPVISLIYSTGDVRSKTAHFLQQRWEEAFGITCTAEALEWNVLFDKMTQGDYQIGAMNWNAWINDPTYTLNAFKYQHNKINFAKWGSSEYESLLNAAEIASDPLQRQTYLAQAEAILIKEVPVIPIFYEVCHFMKKPHLQCYVNSKTGTIDFRRASTKIIF